MLLDQKISNALLDPIVTVLRKLASDERDFTKTILDIVYDISELIDSREGPPEISDQLDKMTLEELTEEELQEASVLATVKCLYIAKYLLTGARLVSFHPSFIL